MVQNDPRLDSRGGRNAPELGDKQRPCAPRAAPAAVGFRPPAKTPRAGVFRLQHLDRAPFRGLHKGTYMGNSLAG